MTNVVNNKGRVYNVNVLDIPMGISIEKYDEKSDLAYNLLFRQIVIGEGTAQVHHALVLAQSTPDIPNGVAMGIARILTRVHQEISLTPPGTLYGANICDPILEDVATGVGSYETLTEEDVAASLTSLEVLPGQSNDDKVLNLFDQLSKLPRARMSLKLFERKYLKMLSPIAPPETEVAQAVEIIAAQTGAKHTAQDIHSNLLNEWLNDIAGDTKNVSAMYYEVDVFDENDNIVFVVPPLAVARELNANLAKEIPGLLDIASMEGSIHPNMGVKRIMTDIIPIIPKPTPSQAHIDGWNKIYAYFGLPQYKDGGYVAKPADSDKPVLDANTVDDLLDFD